MALGAMSIPLKHHYLPEFLQRRWTSATDGKLTEYRRPHREVVTRRVYPSQTGYQTELYAIPSRQDPAERQALESRFMSPLDNLAAEALAEIEAHGRRPSDSRLANAWSRFLLSLMYRTPARVALVRRKVREGDPGERESMEAAYEKLRRPGDPLTVEAFRAEATAAVYEELEAALIRQMIDSTMLGEHIDGMRWSIGTFASPKHGLLLSDEPVMASNGIGKPDGFILLPVSPCSFFMAVNRQAVADAFGNQPASRLERALNDAVVRQATVLVLATDDRHKRFVETRLGKDPAPSGTMERLTWKAPI